MAGILSGVTVVDLTQNVAGPYCTQLLGDLGAEVIKIERPGTGDDTRGWYPPKWGDESSVFAALNRNKKSICIDLDQPEGQEIVRKLCEKADVFLHSLKPGSAESRGLGYEDLAQRNPKLIYAAISAFGDIGPMKHKPGYDPLIQAYTGIISVTGNPGDDPVRVGVSIIDMTTGMWALIGILSALYRRKETGQGGRVGASLLETGVGWVNLPLASFLASGKLPQKMGTGTGMAAPYEAFRTKNEGEWVIIAAGNNRLFKSMCDALGMPELIEDPRFSTNPLRVQHRFELKKIIEERTTNYEMDELVRLLSEYKVPCSPINTLDRVVKDEQVEALEIIEKVDNDRIEDFRIVGLPFRIDGQRGEFRSMPPVLGEHTEEILKSLHYPDEEIRSLHERKIVQLRA